MNYYHLYEFLYFLYEIANRLLDIDGTMQVVPVNLIDKD